jgi:hypothetical protein
LVAFTGLRNVETSEYYLPGTDELPLDNVFTTVELYDPFGMRWSIVAVSTPEKKYEFAGWKSTSAIYVDEYEGHIDGKGIVRYAKKPRTVEMVIDRGGLISPRELAPGYQPEDKNDGGSIDDSDLIEPENATGGSPGDKKPLTP